MSCKFLLIYKLNQYNTYICLKILVMYIMYIMYMQLMIHMLRRAKSFLRCVMWRGGGRRMRKINFYYVAMTMTIRVRSFINIAFGELS